MVPPLAPERAKSGTIYRSRYGRFVGTKRTLLAAQHQKTMKKKKSGGKRRTHPTKTIVGVLGDKNSLTFGFGGFTDNFRYAGSELLLAIDELLLEVKFKPFGELTSWLSQAKRTLLDPEASETNFATQVVENIQAFLARRPRRLWRRRSSDLASVFEDFKAQLDKGHSIKIVAPRIEFQQIVEPAEMLTKSKGPPFSLVIVNLDLFDPNQFAEFVRYLAYTRVLKKRILTYILSPETIRSRVELDPATGHPPIISCGLLDSFLANARDEIPLRRHEREFEIIDVAELVKQSLRC